MLKWILQLVFDEFNYVFIGSGQDLQDKKLNYFLECLTFLIFLYHKNLRLQVSYKCFL